MGPPNGLSAIAVLFRATSPALRGLPSVACSLHVAVGQVLRRAAAAIPGGDTALTVNYFSSVNLKRASITIGFFVAVSLHTSAQSLEEEIRDLPSKDWVTLYWQLIDQTDQAHRGRHSIDSLDNLNFKKVILMIKYHGYPKGSTVPNQVFNHQRSAYVREYYFPIFLDAYLNGKADTFWFMHNVRHLHYDRFAGDLVDPDAGNYRTVLDGLAPWVSDSRSYDLTPFDSLYSTYLRDVHRITDTPPVHRWVTPENDHVSWHRVDGVLYFFKLWHDNSYAMPQPIAYDRDSDTYQFLREVPGTYMRIDKDGYLLVYGDHMGPKRIAPLDDQ